MGEPQFLPFLQKFAKSLPKNLQKLQKLTPRLKSRPWFCLEKSSWFPRAKLDHAWSAFSAKSKSLRFCRKNRSCVAQFSESVALAWNRSSKALFRAFLTLFRQKSSLSSIFAEKSMPSQNRGFSRFWSKSNKNPDFWLKNRGGPTASTF